MEPQLPTDADLVASALAGDRNAFGQLYDLHARRVRAVVAGVSGDWSAVEDLTQESFLRANRTLPKLRDPARFGVWIAGIARHVARERRRSLSRERRRFSPQPAEVESPATGVDVDGHDQWQLVMERLAQLPEQERLAIHAFFLEQQDANQAADLVGLSRSGFYALVQRALARLATRIQSCDAPARIKSRE